MDPKAEPRRALDDCLERLAEKAGELLGVERLVRGPAEDVECVPPPFARNEPHRRDTVTALGDDMAELVRRDQAALRRQAINFVDVVERIEQAPERILLALERADQLEHNLGLCASHAHRAEEHLNLVRRGRLHPHQPPGQILGDERRRTASVASAERIKREDRDRDHQVMM